MPYHAMRFTRIAKIIVKSALVNFSRSSRHPNMSSEFTDTEIHIIREMLMQRYKQAVEIELADCELLLDEHDDERDDAPDDAGATSCPTVYWHARDANFVVIKIDATRYRTQFFYTPHEQYGTGIDEYDNLDECVAAVLQTQADHERERHGVDSGSTGASIKS